MKRRHICDVPGCDRDRPRRYRLCGHCWARLPSDIRMAIQDSFNVAMHAVQGSNTKREAHAHHRAACKRAGEFLEQQKLQRAAEALRRLGERED